MKLADSKDETLLRYLLNEQSKDENEALEDEMVLDPELADRAQVVEMKLIDSYVLNQMSPAERARFEKGFQLFPENREKVEDARAFHESIRLRREAKTHDRPSIAAVSSAWFASLFRIPVLAPAIVVLILVTTIVVVAYLFNRPSNEKVTNNNAPANPASDINPENTREAVNSQIKDDSKEEIAKLNPNIDNIDVSIVEIRGRAYRTQPRGVDNAGNLERLHKSNTPSSKTVARNPSGSIRPHLVKIPERAEFFTLKVSLMPDEYFAQESDCSVDISNSKFQRVFPKGEGNYLKVKVVPTERENFPYQVSIKIPTISVKEGQLYYFRVAETDSLTPFIVKFTN